MAKTLIQGRARAANRLSTWRSEQPLWAGKALGPFAISTERDGFELFRSDNVVLGTFQTFDEAYAKMERAHEEWQRKSVSWVYFIGPVLKVGVLVKIGTSCDVEKRLKQIQAYSAETLSILAKLPGDAGTERMLHSKWANRRRHGEWFRLDGWMIREITRLSSPQTDRRGVGL